MWFCAKYLLVPILFLPSGSSCFFYKYNRLFTFDKIKNIDYLSIKVVASLCNELADRPASITLEQATNVLQKAYLINTNKLIVIPAVVAAYPVRRSTVLDGLLDRKKRLLGGREMHPNRLNVCIIDNNTKSLVYIFYWLVPPNAVHLSTTLAADHLSLNLIPLRPLFSGKLMHDQNN